MITFSLLSLVTSVKDYVEISHKLISIEPLKNYTEVGAVLTYLVFSIGEFLNFGSSLFKHIWSIPILIPDIASAMISEVSVLDGYFHNAFTFLETNVNTSSSLGLNVFEKFIIGLINSLFLFLPTSTSHLITLRRFIMQGLEAGYMAGLGTLVGNFIWLSSIILGWRFFVIPWLSLDIFRYLLGFSLLVKYIWDSSKERRMVLEDLSKWKIFLLNFLLAITEQSCIYPFLSNLSIGPDTSILEGFPVQTNTDFLLLHGAYLFGILLGSFSLLQFTCWFWENPAFSIYLWLTTKSSLKLSTSSYYKILNFFFLYATMLCAIASIPYYGLDYTITNPIGLIPQDRILDQKRAQTDPDRLITETAFLGIKPTDKNSRIRDGIHARRERWKQRLIKYQAFDASLYDQGMYDFLTLEDLNYGFDRFWLRRKMRNHQIRFRLFPGPWMRSLKKQLNNPGNLNGENTKSATTGPRVEFFRILFEQFYHPIFHDRVSLTLKNKTDIGLVGLNSGSDKKQFNTTPVVPEVRNDVTNINSLQEIIPNKNLMREFVFQNTKNPTNYPLNPFFALKGEGTFLGYKTDQQFINVKSGLIYKNSALRKFIRNFNTRLHIKLLTKNTGPFLNSLDFQSDRGFKEQYNMFINTSLARDYGTSAVYSKRWKAFFAKIQPLAQNKERKSYLLFKNTAKQLLVTENSALDVKPLASLKLTTINQKLLSFQRNFLNILTVTEGRVSNPTNTIPGMPSLFVQTENQEKIGRSQISSNKLILLRPLKTYLQKEQAFKRKLRYYGTTTMRKLTVGNQAPIFKTLMKRGFYYYKPSLRWKKTLYVASMRRGFRKKSRKQRVLSNISVSTAKTDQKSNGRAPGGESLFILPQSERRVSASVGDRNELEQQNNEDISLLAGGSIQKPTHSYTVLGKRASRYRHQIYKDVLQHWYYTPFNRLLLKFDVDSFIKRQPKSHFLTKNEERILHLRRFLLSEHYDTLRWYTYMQHYKTMKNQIGGTKSFANRIYNQQFQGTFKKIRHLFAITPKQGDFYTLKYDQTLYNDNKLGQNVYFHEELLGLNSDNPGSKSTDLKFETPIGSVMKTNNTISQSNIPLKQNSNSVDVDSITTKNIPLNSSSIFDINNISDKTLGSNQNNDVINIASLMLGKQFLQPMTVSEKTTILDNPSSQQSVSQKFIYNELFVKLLKESKKRIHDQTFLKNYITYRIEKRDQYYQEQKKELNKRLEKLKSWLKYNGRMEETQQSNFFDMNKNPSNNDINNQTISQTMVLTTGIQKALKDSLNISGAGTEKSKFTGFANLSGQATDLFSKTKNLAVLETQTNLLQQTIDRIKPTFLDQFFFFTHKTDKTLSWWRKKQRVITKRKSSRKRDRFKKQISVINKKLSENTKKFASEKNSLYQTLFGNYIISDYFIDSTKLRKKQETASLFAESISLIDYSKKMSAKGRRYKSLPLARYLTATRKPRLIGYQGFTKIDNISNINGAFVNKDDKQQLLNLDLRTSGKKNVENIIQDEQSIKTSQIKKRSRHAWKKQARHQFSRNYYKYRKRQLHGNGKLRVMNKKIQKHTEMQKFRQWWWTSFLPNYLENNRNKTNYNTSLDSLPKIEESSNKLNDFAGVNSSTYTAHSTTFGPLSKNTFVIKNNQLSVPNPKSLTPMEVDQRLAKFVDASSSTKIKNSGDLNSPLGASSLSNSSDYLNFEVSPDNRISNSNISSSSVNSFSRSPFVPQGITQVNSGLPSTPSPRSGDDLLSGQFSRVPFTSTNLPFYAGWDESLRKFVITNRLLTRRDTGLFVPNLSNKSLKSSLTPTEINEDTSSLKLNTYKKQNQQFMTAPLQGLNEGSFLYWQNSMPFNAYIIDQFITTNQSFYAPLGWRRFEFSHLLLKTWATQKNNSSIKNKGLIINVSNLDNKSLQSVFDNSSGQQNWQKIVTNKLVSRRVKKRYKLVKQTPNILMYSPTGPLLTEVLPSHYISVFDQQYRFPRNRYLKRNTLKTLKKTTLQAMQQTSTKEFTLRKRVKPRRKYHKKRVLKNDNLIFPRRLKFIGFANSSGQSSKEFMSELSQEDLRWRPSLAGKPKLKEGQGGISNITAQNLKSISNKRVKINALRLRQLRRREFQQVIKPLQRYIPQNGGFTWPGDFLRLETVDMPKLQSVSLNKTSLKQKINVQPVGLMPRKYLIDKHNIRVLKKKLEKAYATQEFTKVVREYKNFLQN